MSIERVHVEKYVAASRGWFELWAGIEDSPTPHRIVAFLLRRKSFEPRMAR